MPHAAPGTRRGNLFIVSGPSGAGKGTLVDALVDRVPDIWVSISATTRGPRPGEAEGEHYFFISAERFDELVACDGLLEWAEVHGNRYGTPRGPVEEMVRAGRQVILEIDPQGARQVKSVWPQAILIFIRPPSMDELRRRLEGRGSETPEQVELRLRTAQTELEFAGIYDFVVINDDVVRAADELAAIIDSCSGAREL